MYYSFFLIIDILHVGKKLNSFLGIYLGVHHQYALFIVYCLYWIMKWISIIQVLLQLLCFIMLWMMSV
jgi:hypothetical protein